VPDIQLFAAFVVGEKGAGVGAAKHTVGQPHRTNAPCRFCQIRVTLPLSSIVHASRPISTYTPPWPFINLTHLFNHFLKKNRSSVVKHVQALIEDRADGLAPSVKEALLA